MSEKPFAIKMPCFTLPPDAKDGLANKRAIMLYAQVINPKFCQAMLFLDNGKAVSTQVSRALVERVSRFGPFINLVEVKTLDREAMPILGADGSPVIKSE